MTGPADEKKSQYTSGVGLFLRLFWMGVGNFSLLVLAALIFQNKPGLFSLHDLVYGLVVLLMILSRYLDIYHYQGSDAYGEPAGPRDFQRYVLILVSAAAALWAAAQGAAHYF
jgi:hypothetical protein